MRGDSTEISIFSWFNSCGLIRLNFWGSSVAEEIANSDLVAGRIGDESTDAAAKVLVCF